MPEAAPFYEMNHENPRNPVDDLYDRDENIRNGVPGPSWYEKIHFSSVVSPENEPNWSPL